MRAIKYRRKSTDEDNKQILSLGNQEREIQSIPNYKSYRIVGDEEDSATAKLPNTIRKTIRPGFVKMCEMIEDGEVDSILCWKPNRLARNAVDGGRIIEAVEHGLLIVTPKRTFGREDVFLLYDEFRDAHKYSREVSENTQGGIKTKNEQGKAPLKAWIGYRNTPEKPQGTREILIDELRFPLVRKMWDLLLSGKYTVPKIHKIATEEWGLIRSDGKKLHISGVYRIFTSIFYTGRYIFAGQEYQGIHTPMVTFDEYDFAQRILGSRGKPRFINREFSYTNWIKCICGSSIAASERLRRWCFNCKEKFNAENHDICPKCKSEFSEKLIHTVTYHCSKKKNAVCKQKALSLTKLEKQIDHILADFQLPKDYSDWALDMLRKENEKEITDRQSVEINIIAKIEMISKKLDNLQYKWLSSENSNGELISDEEYKTMKEKLTKERTMEEEKLRGTNYRQQQWMDTAEKAFKFAVNCRYWFRHGTKQQKRAIFQAIGSNPILDNKILCVRLLPAFETIQKMSILGREEGGWFVPQEEIDRTMKMQNPHRKFPIVYPIWDDVRTTFEEYQHVFLIPDYSSFNFA